MRFVWILDELFTLDFIMAIGLTRELALYLMWALGTTWPQRIHMTHQRVQVPQHA
jgi:hypothetical protein